MTDETNAFEILDEAAYQRALSILIDVGTSIAKELKRPSPGTSVLERGKAFDRVSMAVRRTILLSREIAENPVEPRSLQTKRDSQRKQVIRAVDDFIDRKATKAEAPSLRLELLERVDTLDFDADLTHRSPENLIAEICRDLGLCNDARQYPRRTPYDIALLCAQAAAPAGSGLPKWSIAASVISEQNDPPNQMTKERRHL